jgi:hypothetical protein
MEILFILALLILLFLILGNSKKRKRNDSLSLMTKSDFDNLSLNEKIDLLYKDGIHLYASLFELYNFYVDVKFNNINGKITYIKSHKTSHLEP